MKLFNALDPLDSRANCWVHHPFISDIELDTLGYTIVFTSIATMMILALAKNYLKTKRINRTLVSTNLQMVAQNDYLQETLIELQESNQESIRVLQIIAHDLRSPMAAIVGLSGFMIDEHQLSDEDLEVITMIHTSGQDSLKFINEILDRGSAVVELKKECVELYKLLSYCVAQLQYKANEKDQQIVLKGSITHADLNREKIWRVITNLITNAIKFSPVKSRIAVELKTVNNSILISVTDNGIGIPEELKEKIFSLDTQRKRAGTAGEKSFGLGLAVAKQNIELHGGTLTFTSEIDKGTTFLIELPLASINL